MTTFSVFNPATGKVIREIQEDDASDIAAKVRFSRTAQSCWALTPLAERAAIVRRFRQLLVHRSDSLALTLSTETGKPISQARGELGATPGRIDYFLENAEAVFGPRLAHQEPDGQGIAGQSPLEEWVTYEPLGVIANISAWNYPYFVGTNVFVPAILAGNAVVYKPSEHAALTGLALASLWEEAGLPEGVFTLIMGAGPVGKALLEEPVDGVFFTGSHLTGCKIASHVADRLIPVQLELGGKDPAYVASDVDPKKAAEALVDGAFYNNGQSCCAVERIYVHASIAYAFRAAFVAAVNGLKLGDPSSDDTYLGPVTRESHLDFLDSHVRDAVERGATLLTGGKPVRRPGWYYEPTVLGDVTHEMRVMTEETFGPVIGIQVVESDEDAARLMADTRFGLTSSVYSSDRSRATKILKQMPSGTVYWNCCDRVSPRLPWSGRGHSGLGSTLSLEGLRAFVQPKAWHLRRA